MFCANSSFWEIHKLILKSCVTWDSCVGGRVVGSPGAIPSLSKHFTYWILMYTYVNKSVIQTPSFESLFWCQSYWMMMMMVIRAMRMRMMKIMMTIRGIFFGKCSVSRAGVSNQLNLTQLLLLLLMMMMLLMVVVGDNQIFNFGRIFGTPKSASVCKNICSDQV